MKFKDQYFHLDEETVEEIVVKHISYKGQDKLWNA